MPALKLSHLRKSYADLVAVKDLSLQVEKGDLFGFIGPNGAGKTTTINAIMGLVRFEGQISIFGHDVVHEYRAARRRVGLSPQEFDFDRFLTVEETLRYTAGYYGIRWRDAKGRVDELLREFNLESKRDARAEQLSGGMKRRLIIARSLVHRPEILILDEPTAGLDVELRYELWSTLKRINREGTTILLTTHYIEEVERLCNKVAIIRRGELIANDTKQAIMEELGNEILTVETPSKVPASLCRDCHIEREGDVVRIIGHRIRQRAPQLLKRLEKAGVRIRSIDVSHEGLEHVFLRLTNGGGDDE